MRCNFKFCIITVKCKKASHVSSNEENKKMVSASNSSRLKLLTRNFQPHKEAVYIVLLFYCAENKAPQKILFLVNTIFEGR